MLISTKLCVKLLIHISNCSPIQLVSRCALRDISTGRRQKQLMENQLRVSLGTAESLYTLLFILSVCWKECKVIKPLLGLNHETIVF